MKYNPFRPGKIVNAGMFAGRTDETKIIDKALFQTKNGNPDHFLIHGERGIGKSSLLLYAKTMAKTQIGEQPWNFVTVDVELEPSVDYGGIVRKIGAAFANQLQDRTKGVTSKLQTGWDFLKKWEVMGVKYNSESANRSELVDDLCETFCSAIERLSGNVDGVLVLIDETDKPPVSSGLGEFVKVFTERLTKNGCTNVCLGLAGISSVIDKMKKSHESAPRIFKHLRLDCLEHEERKMAIQLGLDDANEKNERETTIRPDAEDWIAVYSEGHPNFIQQYASSAFETDNDWVIDLDDVSYGAFKEHGALDQLGQQYFEDMYHAQINSDDYRKVLQSMAKSPEKYVTRKHIKGTTGIKDTTLSNALQALKSKQIIVPHPEKRGLFKLPTDSFGIWIRAQAKKEEETGTSQLKDF